MICGVISGKFASKILIGGASSLISTTASKLCITINSYILFIWELILPPLLMLSSTDSYTFPTEVNGTWIKVLFSMNKDGRIGHFMLLLLFG